jgi:hypothetical protein
MVAVRKRAAISYKEPTHIEGWVLALFATDLPSRRKLAQAESVERCAGWTTMRTRTWSSERRPRPPR